MLVRVYRSRFNNTNDRNNNREQLQQLRFTITIPYHPRRTFHQAFPNISPSKKIISTWQAICKGENLSTQRAKDNPRLIISVRNSLTMRTRLTEEDEDDEKVEVEEEQEEEEEEETHKTNFDHE